MSAVFLIDVIFTAYWVEPSWTCFDILSAYHQVMDYCYLLSSQLHLSCVDFMQFI